MQPVDVERIARSIVREYGLPFRLEAISLERPDRCVVVFADPYRQPSTIAVAIRCDDKVSAYGVRQAFERELRVHH